MEIIQKRLEQARQFCQEHRRPLVSLCYAQSLDGSIAIQRGKPTNISGIESSRLTHELRAQHDAILVGAGTIISDNPRLTVRHIDGPNPQPVILDSRLRIPLDSYVVQSHPVHPIIATTSQASDERYEAFLNADAQVLVVPASETGQVHLPELMEQLERIGIHSLMVEGGAQVITSLLAIGLVDQAVITIAPVFLGGLPAIENLAIKIWNGETSRTTDWPRLKEVESRWLGGDLVVWGRLGE